MTGQPVFGYAISRGVCLGSRPVDWPFLSCLISAKSSLSFEFSFFWLVLCFCFFLISHLIYGCHPSHWLICFRGIGRSTTNQWVAAAAGSHGHGLLPSLWLLRPFPQSSQGRALSWANSGGSWTCLGTWENPWNAIVLLGKVTENMGKLWWTLMKPQIVGCGNPWEPDFGIWLARQPATIKG